MTDVTCRSSCGEIGDGARIPLYRDGLLMDTSAIVDAEDVPLLSTERWGINVRGYVVRYINERGTSRPVLMHRLLMGLPEDSELTVDHINGCRHDNRKSNLRVLTMAQNLQNKPSYSGSTSQYRGVWWHKGHRKWQARGRLNGHGYHLGYFDDEEQAAACAAQWRAENMPYSVER